MTSTTAPRRPRRLSPELRAYIERANADAYERGREESGDLSALIVAALYGAMIGAGIASAITYELTRHGHM